MLKKTIIIAALAAAFAAGAATPDIQGGSRAGAPVELRTIGIKGESAPAAEAPFKTLSADKAFAAKAPRKGIDIRRQRRAMQSATAVLSESFESMELYSHDLPDGWTQHGTIVSEDPTDIWFGATYQWMQDVIDGFPDGTTGIGIGYNDDVAKDEWLVSPQFTVPESGYQLAYYWYTVPYWYYIIDRFHVDFNNGVFTDRVQQCNWQTLIKVGDGEWTVLYDLGEDFADVEYYELAGLDYDGVFQRHEFPMDAYVGQTVQLAFRYYGIEGNALYLDAVTVDLPAPDVAAYMPSPSRLFYGISADDYMAVAGTSIEFYPVNSPVTWYNITDSEEPLTFSWSYTTIDESGKLVELTDDDQEMLQVTYRPDYFNGESALTNNIYPLPTLTAANDRGTTVSYTHPSKLLQAGGTPQISFREDGTDYHFNLNAFQFDIYNEGYGGYLVESEELGLYACPIFGYDATVDSWWRHRQRPNGDWWNLESYVDGYGNILMPDAPLVLTGANAFAYGKVYDGAMFTMTLYRIDGEGMVDATPIASKVIKGTAVITTAIDAAVYGDLILPFVFDEPVVLAPVDDNTFGYYIEVTGYHDPDIAYFVPMQQTKYDPYELSLALYRYRAPDYGGDINMELSHVWYMQDKDGNFLDINFAIGLDAHYPWLEIAGDSEITIADAPATSLLHGYWPADRYTVSAPDWCEVTLQGRYATTVTFSMVGASDSDRTGTVTISAPGCPEARFTVTAKSGSGAIADAVADDGPADVYNLQGIRVMEKASPESLSALPAGLYIMGGRKIIVNNLYIMGGRKIIVNNK